MASRRWSTGPRPCAVSRSEASRGNPFPGYSDARGQGAAESSADVAGPLNEQDFYDLSYGFRPNRSAHQAIDALDRALFKAGRTVWVLEVDVKSFFDTIDHQALRDLLRLRVGRRPGGPVCREAAPSGGARGWGHHDLCRWNSAGRRDLTPPVEHLPPPCARHLVGEGCAPANAGDGEASPAMRMTL